MADFENIRLLTEVFDLYRSGDIRAPPIATFPAADIAEAYRHFSSDKRLGKVVISFEDEDSEIVVRVSEFESFRGWVLRTEALTISPACTFAVPDVVQPQKGLPIGRLSWRAWA